MDNRWIVLYRRIAFERWGDAGRQGRARMEACVQAARPSAGETRLAKRSGDGEGTTSTEGLAPTLPRKASSERNGARTQTDTGGREENSQTHGRTLVKELGKMTP